MPRPVISPMVKAFNRHLGSLVAERRKSLSLSAAELEQALMVPRGTMARIERGEKGLDAGMLVALAQELDVLVSSFFEGLPKAAADNKPNVPPPELVDEMATFVEEYHGIDDDAERLRILALVRSVAESGVY